jgi:hypothetical protein
MPGTVEPPEPLADRGSGEVPPVLRSGLVATFNGGFPLETSNAGLIYRGQVNGIATVVRYRDGHTDLVRWNHGPGAPANVWFAKQNLPPIIYGGKLNPNLGDDPEWGETVNNATRVWRSGLGIDAHGNLMYAAANQLHQLPPALARRTRFLRRLPEAGTTLVRLPRNVSPAAAERRSLLIDALLGAAIGAVLRAARRRRPHR